MVSPHGAVLRDPSRRTRPGARLLTVLALMSVLGAACTGESGGALGSRTSVPSRSAGTSLPSPSRSGGVEVPSPSRSGGIEVPSPSRSGGIEVPTEQPTPTGGGEAQPTAEPSPKPSKTKEPKPSEQPTEQPTPSPTEQPTQQPTEQPTVVVTVSPQVTITQVIASPTGAQSQQQTVGWLLLLLLIMGVAIALIALASRRRGSRTDWTASAANAYRSCSTLRDRLAQELTATTGTPWTQLLPLVDGASSTLAPLQTAPPDEQAVSVVTHTVEALSAVRLALQAGATTPSPSQEAKASLLGALGRFDAALEPLRFEATGRSGAGPVQGA
jgi:hypothetical protein